MSDQYDDNNIIKCTCGANVIDYQMSEHITRGIHDKNLKLKKDNRILNSTIIIENILFTICSTCQLYIDSRLYNDHLTLNCIHTTTSLPPLYLKGRIKCICNQILKYEENYIKHLSSKLHSKK